ncbi:unnamed protein product [Choristocarpus tenellus]
MMMSALADPDLAVGNLNLQLSDLDVGLDSEGFAAQGVQPGGAQEDAFITVQAQVLNQIHILELALDRSTIKPDKNIDAAEAARLRGMPILPGGCNVSDQRCFHSRFEIVRSYLQSFYQSPLSDSE